MIAVSKLAIVVLTASMLSGGALVALTHGTEASGGTDRGLDTDGDGRFDWLVVTMDLKVDTANYYNVWAVLGTKTPYGRGCFNGGIPPVPLGGVRMGDPTQPPIPGYPNTDPSTYPSEQTIYPISWASVRQFFEAGEREVTLAFKGQDIGLAGVDGPYLVQAQVFADGYPDMTMRPGILPPIGQGQSWEYTTGAYRATDFAQPRWAFQFTGAAQDRGLDANGDGKFDYLVLTADAQVNLKGTYSLSGALTVDPSTDRGLWVTSTYATTDLAEGAQSVEFRFNGADIWASGHSGAFHFMLSAYSNGGWIGPPPIREGEPYPQPSGDFDVYGDTLCGATSPYAHDAWAERVEPAQFTGVFADRGEDLNGNERYDFLVVEAEVNVTEANTFLFSGNLKTSDDVTWISSARDQVYLDVGLHTLTLRFPGPDIFASGFDGPYRADLNLVVAMKDPAATYTTKAYAHGDFDAEGRTTTGTHWISSLKADARTISVTVTRGDDVLTYVIQDVLRVEAYSRDGTGSSLTFSESAVVQLPTGGASQSFTFTWTPTPGTYVVRAMLGDPSHPDAVEIVVTV